MKNFKTIVERLSYELSMIFIENDESYKSTELINDDFMLEITLTIDSQDDVINVHAILHGDNMKITTSTFVNSSNYNSLYNTIHDISEKAESIVNTVNDFQTI